MSVEVLLMAEVKDLGIEGDVVKVANGYARNYLFPKKLAAPVTAATKRKLAKVVADREEKQKQNLLAATETAAALANLSVTIPVKVAEGEKLYGSIGVTEIVEAIQKQGVEIDRGTVELQEPVKELGVYDINIKLHPEIDATVKIWIVEE